MNNKINSWLILIYFFKTYYTDFLRLIFSYLVQVCFWIITVSFFLGIAGIATDKELLKCNFTLIQSGTGSDTFNFKNSCYGEGVEYISIEKIINGTKYSADVFVSSFSIGDLQLPVSSVLNLNTGILRKKLCVETHNPENLLNELVILNVEYQPEKTDESVYDLRRFGSFSEDETCLFFDYKKINEILDPKIKIPMAFVLYMKEANKIDTWNLNQDLPYTVHLSLVFGDQARYLILVASLIFLMATVNTLKSFLENITKFIKWIFNN